MQCPDCLGYRHPGPCEIPEYDAPLTLVRHTNQTCPVNPQTGGATLREAWDNWNRRDKL